MPGSSGDDIPALLVLVELGEDLVGRLTSNGAGRSAPTGESPMRSGHPATGTRPRSGCSTYWIIPRWIRCSSVSTSRMDLTGAQGTPAACSTCTSSARVRVRVQADTSASTASMLATRSQSLANLGSSSSSGRVTGILETVSLSPRGVTLAELATALGAAKSSVQELTNGLLARGDLVEDDGRFHLGPGPFVLAARANRSAALSLDHRFVVELHKALGCNVLVGVRVGDAIVFVDHVGEESPALTYVARTHARRPLYSSTAGKTLLANVPDDDMYRLLDLAAPEQAGEVRQFLAELPEIRASGLAFNRGSTFAEAFVVATPLFAADGTLVAAVSAAVEPSEAARLDDLGDALKTALAELAPGYGFKRPS